MRKVWIFLAFKVVLLACVFLWVFTQIHAAEQSQNFAQAHVEIQAPHTTHRLRVALATTPEQRAQGMQFAKQFPSKTEGMLFVWPSPQLVGMWMKNTPIPLDMVFIQKDGKITKIAANQLPNSEATVWSDVSVTYVLELSAHKAKSLKLNVGHHIKNLPTAHSSEEEGITPSR